ncbi:ethylene-responsive transcription factor 3-like [Zingiber officinale]|uniref:ethylene-responsive transcription factor 3-like n=1 Tax=Zingiber officinale TaxID=94328 RepID=UPI001C4D859B|nr:ethylene-responsive transcription factor 3-like [Zingiber officinale]
MIYLRRIDRFFVDGNDNLSPNFEQFDMEKSRSATAQVGHACLGRFAIEIRDPGRRSVWLGTFDSAEAATLRVPWFQGQDQLSLRRRRCCVSHPYSCIPLPSLRSTVEYFGRPRLPAPAFATLSRRCVSQLEKKAKPLPQRIPDNDKNCHSDCGSSTSVVDDERDIASTYRHTLPFDLNLLPSPDDDIQATILCF